MADTVAEQLPKLAPREEEYPDILSDISPATFDMQSSSPLFTKLPTEVRHEIFRLVLAQYDATSRSYPEEAFYCRPGCTAPNVSTRQFCIHVAVCSTKLDIFPFRPLSTSSGDQHPCRHTPPHRT
jgi:hypothetical protein